MTSHVLLALVLLTPACIGRSVVGKQVEEEPFECNPVSTECVADEPELSPFPESAFAWPIGECSPWLTPAPMTVDAGTEIDGGSMDCTEQAIDLAPGARITLRGMDIRNTHLVVRGGLGSSIVLDGATVSGVRISLADHAWLEVVENSVVRSLVVEVGPEVEGRAVTIADAAVDQLAVRTGERGEIRFERARVLNGTLDVGSLVAAQSVLAIARIRAEDLLLSASDVNAGELEVGDGIVLDGGLSDAAVHRCRSLRLASVTVNEVFFAPCEEPLHISGGTVASARIHGSLALGNVAVSTSAFLPRATDTLVFGDSQVLDSMFCDVPHLTAADGTILCSACVPDVRGAMLTNVFVDTPECPSLEAAAMASEIMDVTEAPPAR